MVEPQTIKLMPTIIGQLLEVKQRNMMPERHPWPSTLPLINRTIWDRPQDEKPTIGVAILDMKDHHLIMSLQVQTGVNNYLKTHRPLTHNLAQVVLDGVKVEDILQAAKLKRNKMWEAGESIKIQINTFNMGSKNFVCIYQHKNDKT